MQIISYLIDLFLHLDEHLEAIITSYGVWTYALLFVIIFMETGLVITPFLPGDSLLFAAGTFAAEGWLNIWVLIIVCSAAAILGDTVNYWIGHFIGPKAFSGDIRFLKKEYLDRTHAFYEKHGGKTIILARFIPIIRTFAPFVAGIGAMTYSHFITYNVVGGIAWVMIFTLLGYFFGSLPFVQHNFELVIIAIIFISVLPGVVEYLRERARSSKTEVKTIEE
jgi:membrane-associated protein